MAFGFSVLLSPPKAKSSMAKIPNILKSIGVRTKSFSTVSSIMTFDLSC